MTAKYASDYEASRAVDMTDRLTVTMHHRTSPPLAEEPDDSAPPHAVTGEDVATSQEARQQTTQSASSLPRHHDLDVPQTTRFKVSIYIEVDGTAAQQIPRHCTPPFPHRHAQSFAAHWCLRLRLRLRQPRRNVQRVNAAPPLAQPPLPEERRQTSL